MSRSDSESTDSDNNNEEPYSYDYYLQRIMPNAQYGDNVDLDDNSSLDFEILDDHSDSEVELLNSSDESDNLSDTSSHSSRHSSLLAPFIRIGGITNEQTSVSVAKPNSWCIPKELYKREIGNYDRRAKWSNNFYQSEVAVQKLKLSKQLIGHKGCVNSLDFNNAGDVIASGSDDCNICLWNWSQGTCISKYRTAHFKNIFQTKFLTTQGDVHIVSSGLDGLIILSTAINSDRFSSKIIARHDRQCNKLGLHPEVPYVILSCGEDGVVKNIDIRESLLLDNMKITNILHMKDTNGAFMKLFSIDINPMNPFEFIINGDDEYVRMFDKRKLSNGPIKMFEASYPHDRQPGEDNNCHSITSRDSNYEPNVTSAVYNYCGTEILASYSEDDIYLFDVNGPPRSYIRRYNGHINKSTLKCVNFYGPRSEYVVSGSDCGCLFIWDKKTEAIVQRKHADARGAVNVLEGHPHMPTLATSGLDKTIKIWEPLSKGKLQNKKKLQRAILKNRIVNSERFRLRLTDYRLERMFHRLFGETENNFQFPKYF